MPKEVGKGRVLRIGKRRALSVSVSLQLRETGELHSVAQQVITCVMNAAALGVSIISSSCFCVLISKQIPNICLVSFLYQCGTVNSVMEDLTTSYPPKCPLCKALINNETVERQLTSAQQNTFRAHAARTALKPGEELIECKECGLFEVVSDDPVLWWCPHCDCGTCRVCNKDLLTGKDKYNIFQSPHNNCVTLREPKALIEQAIEEGSKMRCPSCKLAGRKDDACTHMTCTKCSTSWCYVCGLDVLKCDKAP